MLGDIVPSNTQPTTNTAAQTEPAHPTDAPAPVVTTAVPVTADSPAKPSSKVPLILTLVGIIVFVGGVSGLFMYALSS